jgi:type IV secretion system protein TrbF
MQTEIIEQPKQDDLYIHAQREWDDCHSNLKSSRDNWQRIAFGSIVGIIIALGITAWSLTKVPVDHVYWLIREPDGHHVSFGGPVKPNDMSNQEWDQIKLESLKSFLHEWRMVTTDSVAQKLMWDAAYFHIGQGTAAKKELDAWYREHNPLYRNANEIVSAQYRSYYPRGANTFGLIWEETTRSISGDIKSQKTWQGTFTFVMHKPQNDSARIENPFGILITDFTAEEM